ncbi:hypothetical protein Rmf_00730 [Roseomonas fluvialis]|uniref:Lipoprotein n=2 Tax=Roseomonas fluvialis TaxID=1750527 RepID=A0ABN6NXP6_9PROT|nr:hypothetical protein Rmf_00730 [Roseomonas fluvialis]
MLRMLPLMLLLAACGVAGWQDPPRGLQTLCDDAGARSNIGPETRLDARPRPECRPAAATSSR